MRNQKHNSNQKDHIISGKASFSNYNMSDDLTSNHQEESDQSIPQIRFLKAVHTLSKYLEFDLSLSNCLNPWVVQIRHNSSQSGTVRKTLL